MSKAKKVKDIISELDPNMSKCVECKNYYHELHLITTTVGLRCPLCHKRAQRKERKENKKKIKIIKKT